MLSLFSTSSDQAGFRLHYMEVYNWGTFDEKVFRINPQGNNSLLTGANASGKSTYIDALLTLMVPAKKDRFYNQSSGVDKKGDRTEETYVLGHYGNIQEEGKISTSTQMLRDKKAYSVILVNFKNTDLNQVTLFQVRWFTSSGELNRQFGIAHIPLEIEADFRDFDSKGVWKRRLDKKYNFNTPKKIIEFIDGPTAYAERISGLLGMRSIKALSLFNHVVGVKVLDDLDEFIRTNMLEQQDAEKEFLQLKGSFLTLMDAKINIEKAKEQIKQLTTINEIAEDLSTINSELHKCQDLNKISDYWFAKRIVYLGEIELEKCKTEIHNLKEELSDLRKKENELNFKEREISISIEKDEVGNKIKSLETEISEHEQKKKSKREKLSDYNKIAQFLELKINPNEDDFKQNEESAIELKNGVNEEIKSEYEKFSTLKIEEKKLEQKSDDLEKTIKILDENKNNISGREAEIRNEIIKYIGATKEEIPFIGELIKLKEEEMVWESSIEKVLHNFALRLIVPQKYYFEVNKYVNNNNLRGRIRYDKYEDTCYFENFRKKEINKKSLLNKIEIKSNTQYKDWIENYLVSQFDFICVDNIDEFDRHSEMAITINGLIKFKRGKHEKDDRSHVSKKENYVLGWDNKEKINNLRNEVFHLKTIRKDNQRDILAINNVITNLNCFKDKCSELISNYKKYVDINWQINAIKIQEKTEEKEKLENTNDKVKVLQEQLKKVKEQLKQLREVEINNQSRKIYQKETSQKEIENTISDNKDLFNDFMNIDFSTFEKQNPDLIYIEYSNLKKTHEKLQKETSIIEKELALQKRKKENEILPKITNFKYPPEDINYKFKDWRSEVIALPDPNNLDLISEYQQFFERLKKDNLPKFEKKFNDYLQETITNKVGDFRIFFDKWTTSIKENIKNLNDSLCEIDFKNNPRTYIQLEATHKINENVKEFRLLLDKAIPNIREVDSSIDGRKNHFYNHIEPLMSKLDNEDWRRKVMDVRYWFNYKAEEYYKETKRKFKTYEAMGQLSGGEKAQLTYTVLGSAIAYQFGLTSLNQGLEPKSFRFIAIDEAFKAQDEDKARYLIKLCKQLHLQLLVVTPSDNIHIVENDISFIHFVERKDERHSWLYDMPIEQFKEEKENYLNQ